MIVPERVSRAVRPRGIGPRAPGANADHKRARTSPPGDKEGASTPDPSQARQLDADLPALRKERHLFQRRRPFEIRRDLLRFLAQLIVEILHQQNVDCWSWRLFFFLLLAPFVRIAVLPNVSVSDAL